VLEFTVGINVAGKHESVTVAAEDALIAALKVRSGLGRGRRAFSTNWENASASPAVTLSSSLSPPATQAP
jgi:hypothetical protein